MHRFLPALLLLQPASPASELLLIHHIAEEHWGPGSTSDGPHLSASGREARHPAEADDHDHEHEPRALSRAVSSTSRFPATTVLFASVATDASDHPTRGALLPPSPAPVRYGLPPPHIEYSAVLLI
jgi:hypothetical protein